MSTKHVTIQIPEVFVRAAKRKSLRYGESVSFILQSWMQAGFTALECGVVGDKEKPTGAAKRSGDILVSR
jgi:hypothetical protein